MAKSPRTTTKSASPPRPKATTPKKSPAPGATRASTPNGSQEDAIARRAYEIYQARGGDHGADVEDWLQAEREIRSRGSGAH